jgi:4-hydroxysphinganine ceramide fatty acyl 2-hydroxylase
VGMRRLFQRVSLLYIRDQRMYADSTDWVPREDFHPDETDALADYNRNKFLDLSQPLLMQVWRAKFTKEYYLSQVHNPRHLKESARLFGNSFLEVS